MKEMYQVLLPKNSRTGIRLREVVWDLHLTYFDYLKKLTYFIQQIKKEKDQF